VTEPRPLSRGAVVIGMLVLGALSVLLAVWGAFLVPLRVAGLLVPVSWVVAVVGNVLVGRTAGMLAGRPGTGVAALLWLAVVVQLGSRRAEGDLVVPQTLVGLGYLLSGAFAWAIPFALAGSAPAVGAGRRDADGERS